MKPKIDGNQRFIFEDVQLPTDGDESIAPRLAKPGDYVRAIVDSVGVTTLNGTALGLTTLTEFYGKVKAKTNNTIEKRVHKL